MGFSMTETIQLWGFPVFGNLHMPHTSHLFPQGLLTPTECPTQCDLDDASFIAVADVVRCAKPVRPEEHFEPEPAGLEESKPFLVILTISGTNSKQTFGTNTEQI